MTILTLPNARIFRPGITLIITGILSACTLVSVKAQTSASAYAFTYLAGSTGGAAYADGVGTAARFNDPRGAAVDAAGNIFVADSNNHVIRQITPAGIVSTFAGKAQSAGTANGTGTSAQFRNPRGLAIDGAGNLYVADAGNHAVRKITPAGVVTTFAGAPGLPGSSDGQGSAARFQFPGGIAIDRNGNIFVADSFNFTIRKITPAGLVSTLAGSAGQAGTTDGNGAVARFQLPTGIAIDQAGDLLVADTNNHAIRKISPSGEVTTLAGSPGLPGYADGSGPVAQFNTPDGVALDGSGNLYVTDLNNYVIRKITPANIVTTFVGTHDQFGNLDGTGTAALFVFPSGIALDPAGNFYLTDRGNQNVRKVTSDGAVTTLAGLPVESGSNDGPNTTARFRNPEGIAVDQTGNLFVADSDNHTIRRISPAGNVTTFAGSAGQMGYADGSGPAARFAYPENIAVDASGNIYVTDSLFDIIRKISPAGLVTTLAGSALQGGSADGFGSEARFSNPSGLGLDRNGNVYVADLQNHTIRRISPSGAVTTLAGSAGQAGSLDGVGAAARFKSPQGVAVDEAGNVYVADTGNLTIRAISPAGVVATIAGLPGINVGPIDGRGAAARFSYPKKLTVDGAGNLYVADDVLIRKVTSAGMVTTIAGSLGVVGNANGPGATALFSNFRGIAADARGNLYIADTYNDAIRLGTLNQLQIITQPLSQSVAAGGTAVFSCDVSVTPAPVFQWYHNGYVIPGANSPTLLLSQVQPTDGGEYTLTITTPALSVTSSKATLTVTAAPAPTPTPSPTSGGGGGGGGATSPWFALALLALAAIRRLINRRQPG